jgi:hypothetical protein
METETLSLTVKENVSEIELPIGIFGAVNGQLAISLHDDNGNKDDISTFVSQQSFNIAQVPARETFLTIRNPIIDDEIVEDIETILKLCCETKVDMSSLFPLSS